MANHGKIASASIGIVAFLAGIAYTAHIISSIQLQDKIVSDLYSRIIAERWVRGEEARTRFCSGLNLTPSAESNVYRTNCFDEDGYRFVNFGNTWRVYLVTPLVLVAEIAQTQKDGTSIKFFANQKTVSDFKDKFFASDR